jgi:hypothetical protein
MGDSMRALSISAAWEEVRAILIRDGRLYVSVALALIALPSAINTLLNPSGGMNAANAPAWIVAVTLVASLIALSGQLALIRLALGPSTTVGSAIGHGLRRMPIYLLSIILMVIALFVLLIPLGILLALLGMPITGTAMKVQVTPATSIAFLLFFLIVVFFAVRLILSAPVASAENTGPIAILRRSWTLTSGHWWSLFGFLLLFVVGAIVVLIAVGSAVGVAVRLTLGPLDPMSAPALVFALVEALVSAAVSALFALMLARIYVQLAGDAERVGEVFR